MLIRNLAGIIGTDNGRPYLRGKEISEINSLPNAWLRIIKGEIVGFGKMSEVPAVESTEEVIEGAGCLLLPAFCDSHTHLVYPESRSGEFLDKIEGYTYEQIAASGGGILNSADKLAAMTESDLFDTEMERVDEVIAMGNGALERKSGYGLSLDTELKMLRVIARIAEKVSIPVKATFLGAHAVGRAFAGFQERYVDHLVDHMLPAVAAQSIAEFVDVFCDTGFFTTGQTARILEAASKYGLRPKIHGNELAASGGVEVAVEHDALSVDHLERAGEAQLRLLGQNDTVATMLPGASFFLGMPYADARKAIENNAIVALASDFNPGSSPSGDMRFVMALGCIKMRMTPTEAFNATTVNGAYAMGVDEECGSIKVGKPANLILTLPLKEGSNTENPEPLQLLTEIPYRYTRPWIRKRIVPVFNEFGN